MASDGSPYLSVVVVTRNDDHGGDPLKRLQALVNTFHQQCRCSGLDAEMVVVEWNPPADRPRLATLLKYPPNCAFPLRFVEMPSSEHDRLPYADVLPLFQMIGKNVGIRRSRGQFVLATNIDIIFSNELVEWMASKPFRANRMYRVDRHDIQPQYPVEAPLDDQMSYCRTHHIRLHTAIGTHPTDSNGMLVASSPDIFDPPAVEPVDGWHIREGNESGGFYRWTAEEAVLRVRPTDEHIERGPMLYLDIEPNPYDSTSWVDLQVCGEGVLSEMRLSHRRQMYVALPVGAGVRELSLKLTGHSPVSDESLPEYERRPGLLFRAYSAKLSTLPLNTDTLSAFSLDGWRQAEFPVDLTVDRDVDGLHVTSGLKHEGYCLIHSPMRAPASGAYAFAIEYTILQGDILFNLLDVSKDEWIPAQRFEVVRGKRREMYIVCDLKRGQRFAPHVTNFVPRGEGKSRFIVHSLRGSPRIVSQGARSLEIVRKGARVLRLIGRRVLRSVAYRVRTRMRRAGTSPSAVEGTSRPPTPSWTVQGMPVQAFLKRHRPASLAQNACGDFQLMAREHWLELRGYPEFHMYSMNIDGLFADIAQSAGIEEERLEMPKCVYHLEHEKGSGWTPEGEALLRKRIAESGITWLDWTTVGMWGAYMAWLKRPMIFNGPDWGAGNLELPETVVDSAQTTV